MRDVNVFFCVLCVWKRGKRGFGHQHGDMKLSCNNHSILRTLHAPCPSCPFLPTALCVFVWKCPRARVCPAGLIREGLVQEKFVAPGPLIHPLPAGLGPLMKRTKVDQIQLHTQTHSHTLFFPREHLNLCSHHGCFNFHNYLLKIFSEMKNHLSHHIPHAVNFTIITTTRGSFCFCTVSYFIFSLFLIDF